MRGLTQFYLWLDTTGAGEYEPRLTKPDDMSPPEEDDDDDFFDLKEVIGEPPPIMIGDILSSILSMFHEGSKFHRERGELRDAALDSIYMACAETKLYATDWERTGKRNRKREEELARLWKKASIPVRHFDPALADKCFFKGEYWLDPDHWDDGDTRRLGIDLDRVILEARDLKVMDDETYERHRLRRRNPQ